MKFILKVTLASFIFSLFFFGALQSFALVNKSKSADVLGDTTAANKTAICPALGALYRQYCSSVLPTSVGPSYPPVGTSTPSSSIQPQNILASPSGDGAATVITWTTAVATKSTVVYGPNAATLSNVKTETTSTTSHRLVLSPLKFGQSYFFAIRANEHTFDNGGIPFSFKTPASAVTPAPAHTLSTGSTRK